MLASLDEEDEMRAGHERIGHRAVVLGASMAGLLAARVLADRFAEVVVVDRDELPPAAAHRRGVPQGRHTHALLAAGQAALEQLLPGLTDELAAAGAPVGDLVHDTRMLMNGHRLRQAPSDLVFVSVSRPLLEDRVRRRVRALPEVRIVERCDAVGLVTSADRRHVTGVRLLRRADGSAPEVLDAGLVVDATGRGSRAPDWLAALGYPPPEEDRVEIDAGYASRSYRLPVDALDGDLGCLHGLAPDHPRGAGLSRLEDDRWLLSLIGVCGDHPPTDPDGFTTWAGLLRHPDIADAIARGEPLDDPRAHRFPASVHRRYDRLDDLPGHFIALGDAVCCLDPAYGQGMTVAALEAVALRHHLARGHTVDPHRWYREVARIVAPAWDIAAGGDLAFPDVPGRQTPPQRLVSAYLARLHAAAADDGMLAHAFGRVLGLVDPPPALLRPAVAARVATHALTAR